MRNLPQTAIIELLNCNNPLQSLFWGGNSWCCSWPVMWWLWEAGCFHPQIGHLDQRTSRGSFSSSNSWWGTTVEFHGCRKELFCPVSERKWKPGAFFTIEQSFFFCFFFFNKVIINMYKESQHKKFLLQKREAPSNHKEEPSWTRLSSELRFALALVRVETCTVTLPGFKSKPAMLKVLCVHCTSPPGAWLQAGDSANILWTRGEGNIVFLWSSLDFTLMRNVNTHENQIPLQLALLSTWVASEANSCN